MTDEGFILGLPTKSGARAGHRAVGIVLLLASVVFGSAAGAAPDEVLAIRGGTVLTMAGEPIIGGTVLVRNGRIADIGVAIEIPRGARIVEAAGRYLIPGLINAETHFGLRPSDQNSSSSPVNPDYRVIEAFSPVEAGALISGGVTTVSIAAGSGQAIGGQGAVVKTAGETSVRILSASAGLDMALGSGGRTADRMNRVGLIRKALVGGREAVGPFVRGERPVRIEARSSDDIRAAVRIGDEFRLRIVIKGGEGAGEVREILAERKIPVVLGPVFSAPGIEAMGGENEATAARLVEAGVKIVLAGFDCREGKPESPNQGRRLLLEAALATAFGLDEGEALKAVTINAAEVLGVAGRVGSLEKGKDADIVVLDGPPLSLKTQVEQVYINGRIEFEKKL